MKPIFDSILRDFGREVAIFVTAKSEGQYYYATLTFEGRLDWHRQVHEQEVTPIMVLKTEAGKDLAKELRAMFLT